MPLKHTIETVIRVDEKDLEAFIAEEYPNARRFEFSEDQSNGMDGSNTFYVRPETLHVLAQDRVTQFAEGAGPFQNLTNMLLTDLCNRGRISAGTYIIDVWWR